MPQLNLVLHGTWGIEENNNGIRLVTVRDIDHVLRAGDRDNPSFNLSGDYTLEGVNAGNATGFKESQNATIRGPHRAGSVEVSINLAYPREIHSVRRGPTNGALFVETDVITTPPEMAVTQILVYDVGDLKNVKLKINEQATGLGPIMQPGDGTEKGRLDESELLTRNILNIHFYATSQNENAPGDHFVRVFQALGRAFNLSLTQLRMLDIPPNLEADDQVPGVSWRDTVTLHELRNRPAVSPNNCSTVVIKNRSSSSTAD
jgi:hypothetical protein